jgi:hypothetical protein
MISDSEDNGDKDQEPVGIRVTVPPSDRSFSGMLIPTVPDEFLPAFGRVAVIWSEYENLFENLLVAFLQATSHPDQRWRGLSYEKKAKLLRDKTDQVFCGYRWIFIYIVSTLDAADRLQRERNLLLHGRLIVRFGDAPHEPNSRVCIRARGRRKGQVVERFFTLRDINNLYAEISYAASRLALFSFNPNMLFPMMYQMVPPHGSLLDIFELGGFLRNNYPYRSNDPTPADQPEPSQG